MALFNSFQFGDVDSKDYGVYISGDSVYDSPARSVDLVQVPGRNGALALDNGYYENIEVTYPAGSFGTSQEEWREKMLGIRNALAAQRGYQRLIDTYHPEHYRLGMFFAGISASPVQYNRAGQFPIRFNCKPQRFLISGDEAVTVDFDSYKIADNDEPYLFRKSGGSSDIGDADRARIDHLTGGTIAWKQIYQTHNSYYVPSQYDLSSLSIDVTDGYLNVTGTSTSAGRIQVMPTTAQIPANHVCLMLCDGWNGFTWRRNGFGVVTASYFMNRHSVNWDAFATIGITADTAYNIHARFCSFDLTAMFGSTIADYIYNLERSSVGAGAALFKSMFPKPYYPYDAGSLVSVNTTGRKVVGFNQWDEQWELGAIAGDTGAAYNSTTRIRAKNYIPVVGGDTYYFKMPRVFTLCWYDADKNYISGIQSASANYARLAPDNAMYLRFSLIDTTYNNDICINLSDESKNGTYEPYTSQTYAIPSTDLRGALRLNGSELVYDGDVMYPSMGINRRYGYVAELGTLNWSVGTASGRTFFRAPIADIHKPDTDDPDILIVSNIEYCGIKVVADMPDKTLAKSPGNDEIRIYDSSISTLEALRSKYGAGQLVYPLKASTTETATEWESVQNVYAGGTEEFIDEREVAVPVGHTTDYFNSEGYQLTNPTNFPAKPLIRVYGNGSVQVGDTIATVQNNADGYVDIDCESMNCYDTTGGRNADVSFSSNDFPELASGDNGILLTGPSKVEITPRWWEL